MDNKPNPNTDRDQPVLYEIRVEGHLGTQWAGWFGGLTIMLEDCGDTLFTGPVVDQAALHGLLKKVRDLGMPLVSVNRISQTNSNRRKWSWRKGMKAIIYEEYGSPDALKLKEVEKPVPADNQVLVKVHAASINALDRHALMSDSYLARIIGGNGLRKPKDQRLGADIAGVVEAVGSSVTQFQPGDAVFGGCQGGMAEYALAREHRLALKPANRTFEEAAAVPVAALTALQGLRDKGNLHAGQKVLIQGASGGVGSFAVQIAKAFGAEVTAVCSTRNVDTARALGANHVIDYRKEDFTQNGRRYDLILAVNGYHSIFAYRRALNPQGVFLLAGASVDHLFQAIIQTLLLGRLLSRKGGKKLGFLGIAVIKQQDLIFMKELLEAGKVNPVIDACYPIERAAEAFRYFEEVHPKGKVIITMG